MEYIAVNDKIVFEVKQAREKSGLFSTDDLGNMRIGKVLSVGRKVEEIKVGSEITLPFQDITFIGNNMGTCLERNVVYMNGVPTQNRLEIKLLDKGTSFEKLFTGEVVNNGGKEFEVGDILKFKDRTFTPLPNENILISEDKIYLKKS